METVETDAVGEEIRLAWETIMETRIVFILRGSFQCRDLLLRLETETRRRGNAPKLCGGAVIRCLRYNNILASLTG